MSERQFSKNVRGGGERSENQIPKVIHYVWFGRGKKSPLIRRCIKSWRKVMPDYEIIEWNEDNFNINANTYCRQAYEKKKYAFAADYARLWILYNYGGICMDTDTASFKPLDRFLYHSSFACFESNRVIALGTVGAVKGDPMIKYLLEYYDDREFLDPTQPGGIDWTPNTSALTERLLPKGLVLNNQYQEVAGLAIYPSIFFCEDGEGPDKYATHYFTATWLPEQIQRKNARHRAIARVKKRIRRILGNEIYEKLKSALRK